MNTGILVLGAGGMLGHKMVERLRLNYINVVGLTRKDFDAADHGTVGAILLRYPSHVVINCVGAIKQRNPDPISAFLINAGLPNYLRDRCLEQGRDLIHFSTDCVFSGSRGNYKESDITDATDIYGRSKLLGELYSAPNALTIRTSIIGRERANYFGLLEWFLQQSGEIEGHENAIFSGVTTNWLAETVALLLWCQRIHGLYNIAAPPVSKYDLLQTFKRVYNKDISIIPVSEPFCDRSLDGSKFQKETGIVVPDLEDMIYEQREQDLGSGYAI